MNTDTHIGNQRVVSLDSEIEILDPPQAVVPLQGRVIRKRAGEAAPENDEYHPSEDEATPVPPSPALRCKRLSKKKADENDESDDETQQRKKRCGPTEPHSPSTFVSILRELQVNKMAALEQKEQANAKELELVKEQRNLVEAQLKLRESQRIDNEAAEAKAAREKEEKVAEALAAQATETPVRNVAAAAASLPTPVSAPTPASASAPALPPNITCQLFSVLLDSMQPAS